MKSLERTAAVLGALAAALFLLFRFESFPALHGDEAWIGLFALRIARDGLYTPHLMNDYTGALYGWIVMKSVLAFGIGVFALRIIPVLLNASVALAATAWAWRRFGSGAGAAMGVLLSASPMFLYFGRVSWDVSALQNALVLALLASSRPFVDEEEGPSFWRAAFFLLVVHVGVLNHMIFLSLPISFFFYSAGAAVFLRERSAQRMLPLAACALVMAVLEAALKRNLSDSFFLTHRSAFLTLYATLPLIFALAHDRLLSRGVLRARAAAALRSRSGRFILKSALVAGSGCWAVYHLVPLIQILSGVVVFKRMLAYAPPLWALAGLTVWAALLVCVFVRGAARAARGELPPHARFVVLWTAVYCAVFIITRHTSSIRYYIPMHMMLLSSLAVLLPKERRSMRLGILAAGVLLAIFVQAFSWREAAAPVLRPPLQFRIGFRREKSIDFMPKEELYFLAEREKICALSESEPFLDLPLMIDIRSRPRDCDFRKTLNLKYCWDCPMPPYFRWTITQ